MSDQSPAEPTVSVQQLADWLGLGRRSVADIIGVADVDRLRGLTLRVGARAVVAHYLAVVNTPGGQIEEEKVKLLTAQRKMAEIELAGIEGNKVDVGEAKDVIQRVIHLLARALDRLPTEVAGAVMGCTTVAEVKQVIDRRVRQIRTEMASPAMLGSLGTAETVAPVVVPEVAAVEAAVEPSPVDDEDTSPFAPAPEPRLAGDDDDARQAKLF